MYRSNPIIATNGRLLVWINSGADIIETIPSLPVSISVADAVSIESSFSIDGVAQSEALADVQLRCAFVDAAATTNIPGAAALTVVSPKRIVIPAAPSTGLCVLKGATVAAHFDLEPAAAVEAYWQTARRKTKEYYDPWVLRNAGTQDAVLAMPDAGVFALRAVAVCGGGCQSNAVEYTHVADEPYVLTIQDDQGPNKVGMKNHVGVADTQDMLNLRNAALAHLNRAEYCFDEWLMPRNGFSVVKSGRWKCNAFVADMAVASGIPVLAIHMVSHRLLPDNRYPPTANDWALGNTPIPGWSYLGSNVYPEPGFIAGHPNPSGMGHCGIVDYDGWTISARRDGIGRNSTRMLDGTCGYSKPEENVNEN